MILSPGARVGARLCAPSVRAERADARELLMGLLGQRRPGSDGYAPKDALLFSSGHWGPKLGNQLGARGLKDCTFSREVSLADVWNRLSEQQREPSKAQLHTFLACDRSSGTRSTFRQPPGP